jgi:hypothetical protein
VALSPTRGGPQGPRADTCGALSSPTAGCSGRVVRSTLTLKTVPPPRDRVNKAPLRQHEGKDPRLAGRTAPRGAVPQRDDIQQRSLYGGTLLLGQQKALACSLGGRRIESRPNPGRTAARNTCAAARLAIELRLVLATREAPVLWPADARVATRAIVRARICFDLRTRLSAELPTVALCAGFSTPHVLFSERAAVVVRIGVVAPTGWDNQRRHGRESAVSARQCRGQPRPGATRCG